MTNCCEGVEPGKGLPSFNQLSNGIKQEIRNFADPVKKESDFISVFKYVDTLTDMLEAEIKIDPDIDETDFMEKVFSYCSRTDLFGGIDEVYHKFRDNVAKKIDSFFKVYNSRVNDMYSNIKPHVCRFNFEQLQAEQKKWSKANGFDKNPASTLGINEEYGELISAFMLMAACGEAIGQINHATLKMKQSIRGTEAEHRAELYDAIGDLVIYLAGFCTEMGFELQDVVETTWNAVSKRDWKKNPDGEGY